MIKSDGYDSLDFPRVSIYLLALERFAVSLLGRNQLLIWTNAALHQFLIHLDHLSKYVSSANNNVRKFEAFARSSI